MFSRDNAARALALAKAYYEDGLMRADPEFAASHLDMFGLFSLPAIAAIVQTSEYKIKHMVFNGKGMRGSLNPQHIDYLMYMLDGIVRPHWLKIMLDGGTTMNTISRITGISRSTLNRKVWDGKATGDLLGKETNPRI